MFLWQIATLFKPLPVKPDAIAITIEQDLYKHDIARISLKLNGLNPKYEELRKPFE